MATADEIATLVNAARRMAERARLEVGSRLESDTLRRALDVRVDATSAAVDAILSVPHYWALYYHDGRGEIRPRNGKFLVWFRSIEDDPRVRGGYPERANQIRRLNLSPAEFKRLRDAGKLIVARRSSPAAGKPFYEVLNGLNSRVGDIALDELRDFLRVELSDVLDLRL